MPAAIIIIQSAIIIKERLKALSILTFLYEKLLAPIFINVCNELSGYGKIIPLLLAHHYGKIGLPLYVAECKIFSAMLTAACGKGA